MSWQVIWYRKAKIYMLWRMKNSDTQLVLNVTSAELNTRMEDYDKEITGAAFMEKQLW